MSEASVDLSEVNALTTALGRVPARLLPEVRGVVERGAVNVKNEARRFVSGLRAAPAYPASITYDVSGTGLLLSGAIEAEIGPDKAKRQGALGNILEYGTINNAPHAHLGPALDREGPAFEANLERVAAKALEDL